MATTTHRDSAKVYAFPPGGRASRGGSHRKGVPAQPTPAKVVESECGSGWYHEAAVAEAEHASALAKPVRLFTDRI